MSFQLPALPFGYADLEPYIDTQTMHLHHQKHHDTYVTRLNEGVNEQGLSGQDIISLLSSNNNKIRNNGGGHYNHSLFWNLMCKPGTSNTGPTGALRDRIDQSFGSVDEFKKRFSETAAQHFGSGWAWLGVAKTTGELAITTTANQDCPLVDGRSAVCMIPFFGLDVWEHAYYLKYQNRRPEYIAQFWNVCNWDKASEYYEKYALKGIPVSISS